MFRSFRGFIYARKATKVLTWNIHITEMNNACVERGIANAKLSFHTFYWLANRKLSYTA